MPEENTKVKSIVDGGVDMGFNVYIARKRRKLKQEELAGLLGIRQADVSALENQQHIDNDILLEKIAVELKTTVDYLKKTKIDEILEGNKIQYNDLDVNSATDSKEVVAQGYDIHQIINYLTPELKEAQQALLDEKDIRIKEGQETIAEQKERIKSLEKLLTEVLNK